MAAATVTELTPRTSARRRRQRPMTGSGPLSVIELALVGVSLKTS
jgi:hypothetical protein